MPIILLGQYLLAFSGAQTPVALPYTMTTIGDGLVTAGSYSSGVTCPGSTSTMTSAYGDNCAAVAAIPSGYSTSNGGSRGGVAVDAYGNVFFADDNNNLIHRIDANTGVMSVVAGGGSACTGKQDVMGDGCLASKYTKLSGPRGIALDPWGNVFVADYSYNAIHIICRTASPLCTSGTATPTSASPVQVQVGYMGLVAGCVATTSSTGVSAKGSDNYPGYSTSSSSLTAFNNSGACSANLGEEYLARGVAADIYGNVYYAETAGGRYRVVVGPQTSSYFSGTNPLYAALGVYYSSVTPGYAYTIAGLSATATTTGNSCSVTTNSLTYTGAALDTLGDGCPFSLGVIATSSSNLTGIAVDAAGNVLIADLANGLRVLFVSSSGTAGANMVRAIEASNSSVSAVQAGFIYRLAGGGSSTITGAPQLGNSTIFPDSTSYRLTVSPQGNIYIGDANTTGKVFFYDIYTGAIRLLLTSGSSNATKGNYCNGSSGAVSKSAYGDGCPSSYAVFNNTHGLSPAVDGQGNLYLYDNSLSGTSPFNLVRKVLAQGTGTESTATLNALASAYSSADPLQSLGTTQTQTWKVHFPMPPRSGRR